ncbi:MAG: murein hydrolase activator EnvC family protein [Caulobacteraceae bacterium]
MKRKLVAILLVFVLAASCISIYGAAPNELDKLKEQQDKINKELKQTQNSIKQINTAKKSVSKQIEDLDSKINQAENDLDNVETQLAQLENQIAVTTRELERATGDADGQKELLKKRVRVMYENGNVGYLSVLLDSTNFADLISRIDFLKKIVDFDMNLLTKMKDYRNSVEEKRNQLKEEQAQQEKLKKEISDKKETVEQSKQEKQKTLTNLLSDLKELERQEDQLLEQSNEIGRKIVSLQSKEKYVGGIFSWPAPGYYKITSQFGYRTHPILKKKKLHTGIDIAVPRGTTILAANAGKVIYSGYYGGYGNAVIIDHGGKISSLYAHNDKLLVKVGETVTKGQEISISGSTGLSTGPHLHFEVRENGQPVDPMKYVKGK